MINLKAQPCPSGRMPVVIGPGFGGVIFHEACGHLLETTSVAKKASVFHDKMDEMIAHPTLSAVDDGTRWRNDGDWFKHAGRVGNFSFHRGPHTEVDD